VSEFGFLVCPRDRTSLVSNGSTLLCEQGHSYPVVDGIPVLLLEELPSNTAISESLTFAYHGGEDPIPFVEQGIHPQVSRMISATNGILYKYLVGDLPRYPIPELRLANGGGRQLLVWCPINN